MGVTAQKELTPTDSKYYFNNALLLFDRGLIIFARLLKAYEKAAADRTYIHDLRLFIIISEVRG